MDLQGPLWEGVLPGVLRRIYVGRRTGLLTLAREAERRRVRFHVGNIANAETNVQEDRLGDLLVRHGILQDTDLKRATGVVLRENKKLGKVLIELGLLTPDALREALAAHVDVVLSKVFGWAEGHYEFREEIGRVHDVDEMTLPFSTGDLILRASRSVGDPDVVRYHLGDMDRALAFSRDPLLRFQKLNLTAVEGLVLSRIDGLLTAKRIVELLRLPPDEVRSSFFALLNTGVVEYMAKAGDTLAMAPPRPLGARAAPVADAPAAQAEAAALRAPAERTAADASAEERPAPMPQPGAAPAATAENSPPSAAREPAAAAPPDAAAPEAAAGAEPAPAAEPVAAPAASLPADPAATIVLEPGLLPHEPEYSTSPRGEPAIVLNRNAPEAGEADQPVEWLPLPDIEVPPAAGSALPRAPSRAQAAEPVEVQRREILGTREALGTRDHYQLLGLQRGADDSHVREAYFRMAKRFHPDRHHEADLADLRDALEAIFVRLGEAYEVLRSPRLRARYDKDLAAAAGGGQAAEAHPEDPEKAIRRAAASISRERFWEALPLLETAVPRATGAAKQRGRILLARIYARDPDWVKQAEELLLAVVHAEPGAAEAHFYLGVIYRHLGLRSRALAAFRKVAELEPESVDAWVQIAELDRLAPLPPHVRKLIRGR